MRRKKLIWWAAQCAALSGEASVTFCYQSVHVSNLRLSEGQGRDWFLTSSPEIFPASDEAEMCGGAFLGGSVRGPFKAAAQVVSADLTLDSTAACLDVDVHVWSIWAACCSEWTSGVQHWHTHHPEPFSVMDGFVKLDMQRSFCVSGGERISLWRHVKEGVWVQTLIILQDFSLIMISIQRGPSERSECTSH